MKRSLKSGIGIVALSIASTAIANDIPELQSAISNLPADEIRNFETQMTEVQINQNIDAAVEISLESGEVSAELAPELSTDMIGQALAEGFLSETDAESLTNVVEIYQANEKYFDFDFDARLRAGVAAYQQDPNTGISPEAADQMMQAFDQLSVQAKTLVGQEDFDFDSTGDGHGLPSSDWAIICSISCIE